MGLDDGSQVELRDHDLVPLRIVLPYVVCTLVGWGLSGQMLYSTKPIN